MIGLNKAAPTAIFLLSSLAALFVAPSCERTQTATSRSDDTLTVGFGLTTGDSAQSGMRETVKSLASERLLVFGEDGRPQGGLVENWALSDDGLRLQLQLRSGVKFHDGTVLTAAHVADSLKSGLPALVGPAFADVSSIDAVGESVVEVSLHRRSNFVFEGLELVIQKGPNSTIGTGPFYVTSITGEEMEMRAFPDHHSGAPEIDRILFRPYQSTRAAWADLLRDDVDMLFEAGVDALDSLQPSTRVNIYTFLRPYAYTIILNVSRPALRDARLRRSLNSAIDREQLIREGLKGHGSPSIGPVWLRHWAFNPEAPGFEYRPVDLSLEAPVFTCIVADASHERFALAVQKQMRAVGVEMRLEMLSLNEMGARIKSGDFDALLADAISGPTLLRPSWFWHSKGSENYGHFNSPAVDTALDSIRHAPNDDAYRAGVAAFQRAIVDDPPAIFLAWSERARAVSTRFEVPADPGKDILGTLRLWRPAADIATADVN